MADYQGLIRVGIQGLGQIRQLNTELERATELFGNLENAQIVTGQIGQSASRNVSAAARRRAQAGRDLASANRTVENVAQRRDPATGLYLPGGPNATARRLASAQLRLARREARQADRNLREEIQNRRLIAAAEGRYARALDRTAAVLGGTQQRIQEQQLRNRQTMQGIGNASRGNYLTNLFQGRLREFAQRGAGVNLSPELQQQARNVRAAWDIATAGGQENLRLMQRLATEMAGLLRQQNTINFGRAGRSVAFESGRRGQEKITDLSRMSGADPARIRRLRSLATDVISASNLGDVTASRMATRRMNASIGRYQRELNRAAQELSTQRQARIRNFNVAQSWRAVSAEAQRLNAMPRALPDANMLASRIARTSGGIAPARLDELKKQEAKQLAAELKVAEGRPERFRKKLSQEEKRQERLGISANTPARVGGSTRRTNAIPMGGGADSGIMPRALPNDKLLAARIAGTVGGVAPVDLLKLRKERDKQEEKQIKEETKAAQNRPKRFREKLLEEERRQEKLGIGANAPARIGGPVKRTGAIPMGGGVDSGIMPRALPSSNMLAERVANARQVQPTRLDDLQAAAQERAAEETKRAAGSVGRFAAALEREEKRLASLGIGAPGRVGGTSSRSRAGAIPMGGQGGRPGMFDQYPFPAGPGNQYGAAEFSAIQKSQRAQQRQQGKQKGFFQGDLRKAAGEGLIGGAFPLLFGQGLGASVGGAVGGGFGGAIGGSFGFGLSLAGTAIGQAVDTTAANLKELASALKSPADAITALETSGFRVGDSLKLQVQQLQSVGRAYDAQTLVLQEVQKRLGPGSLTELRQLDAAQKKLQEQYAAIAAEIQVRLLPVLQGFVEFLGIAAGDIGGFASQSRLQRLDPAKFEELRSQAIRESSGFAFNIAGVQLGFNGSNQKKEARLSELSKQELSRRFANERAQVPLSTEQKLEGEITRLNESRKIADQIQSAYREAFNLQRQAHDLQRDGAMLNRDIADYSYKKEREIFDLRQQAAEKQIENNRASAQNRIESGDLNARQTFAAATGFEQQLLSNVREVVRTRREGEADIEQSRNRLELAMAKLNRDVEDYKRTNAREIEDIEQRKQSYARSVEDYKIKVADYVLQRSRESADLMRQAMTLPDIGAPAAGAGGTPLAVGAAPRTLMGVPGVVEYLTGDKSSPGYRADHGGSNYHEHIAFASRKIRDNVIAMLQSNGIKIGSTDGGSHAVGSYHYSGQAVDIPASQVPVGKEDALAGRVRALVAAYLGGPAGQSVQGQSATQISSISQPKFNPVAIGATPSAAPLNAANMAARLQLAGGEKEALRILEEQNKLKLKGIGLGQVEQILQSSQLPQLKQQGDTLKQQIEARQKILDLSDNAASVADIEAESKTRLAQIEKDRVSALAQAQKQYGNDTAIAKQINNQADKAASVAKGEEKQRRTNLDLSNKLQNQERSRSAILQLQEGLAVGKAQAAALERGELEATGLELLKASDLYRFASDAEKAKLATLTAQTEELQKQNEFKAKINELDQSIRFAGAGLRAGFTGEPARAFEQGLKDFNGDMGKAAEVATRTKRLEDQQLVWGNLEKNIIDVSNAISGSLTNGLVDIVGGARRIEDVGRDMLNSIAGSFADSAQQQLTTLLQRQLGGLLGGAQGPLVKMLGAGGEVAGTQALGAASMAASGSLWGLSGAAAAAQMALQTIAAQAAFSGALGGGSALSGALGSALSGSAPNLFSKAIPDFIPSLAFGGFLAEGGMAKAGQGYVVGEEEPEFFFPGVSGRVVPRSDMQKAEALRQSSAQSEPIDIRYTVTEQQGQRFVTEEQFRKGMDRTSKRTQAMTYAGMRNNSEVRNFVGI